MLLHGWKQHSPVGSFVASPQAKLLQLQQAGGHTYKKKLLTLFLCILGPGAREKTLLTVQDLRPQRHQTYKAK
jgi:hypothetical protein